MFKNYEFLIISLINFKNVALIFPSKKILKNQHGKKINNFKYVIRLNNSTTKKYIKNVGIKTSLRILSSNFINKNKNQILKIINKEKLLFVSYDYLTKNKKKKLINFYKKNSVNFIDNRFFFFYMILKSITIHPIFTKLIFNHIFKNKILSTGFVITLILIFYKIKPTFFGLDLDENMRLRSHYHKNEKISDLHDLKLEHDILRILKRKKIITVID